MRYHYKTMSDLIETQPSSLSEFKDPVSIDRDTFNHTHSIRDMIQVTY